MLEQEKLRRRLITSVRSPASCLHPLASEHLYSPVLEGLGGRAHFPGVPAEAGQTQGPEESPRRAAPRPSAEALSVSEGPAGPEALPASQAEPRSRTARARLTGTFFVPQRSSVPRQQKTSGKRGPSPEHRAVQVLRPAALGWCVCVCGGAAGGPLRSGHPHYLP